MSWNNSKLITFVGDKVLDVILYLSKINSFNKKILIYDMSHYKNLMVVVSPDGYDENQNIVFSDVLYDDNINASYDLIITYSDHLCTIPDSLLKGDVYLFITSQKYVLYRLNSAIERVMNMTTDFFIVCRENHYFNTLYKRVLASTMPLSLSNNILMLKETEDDAIVLSKMENDSVFLYEYLSAEMKEFLLFIYKRINIYFNVYGIHDLPECVRFKWTM